MSNRSPYDIGRLQDVLLVSARWSVLSGLVQLV